MNCKKIMKIFEYPVYIFYLCDIFLYTHKQQTKQNER